MKNCTAIGFKGKMLTISVLIIKKKIDSNVILPRQATLIFNIIIFLRNYICVAFCCRCYCCIQVA